MSRIGKSRLSSNGAVECAELACSTAIAMRPSHGLPTVGIAGAEIEFEDGFPEERSDEI
jgi:hypothetical protein